MKNIDKKAREFIEETGVNVAYMAFGFIHWKESDSSSYVFRAPVLLVPIQLEQASAVEPYFIKSAEDDIMHIYGTHFSALPQPPNLSRHHS